MQPAQHQLAPNNPCPWLLLASKAPCNVRPSFTTITQTAGDATGVSQRDAKLAFVRSLCVVVDEVGPRGGRAVCLDRCDFMEALCRMAEELAPPAREQVAAALKVGSRGSWGVQQRGDGAVARGPQLRLM